MIPYIKTKKWRGYAVLNRQFFVDGKFVWCNDTGYEVFVGGDPEDENNYYNEFIDYNGDLHYAKN